jgi:hypothetical protein
MPDKKPRELCPGLFYAEAITNSLIKEFKKTPLSDKEARETALLAALDYAHTLSNVAEPLVRGTDWQGEFDALAERLKNLARPWHEEHNQQFLPCDKVQLAIDVVYELQREVIELKREVIRRRKKQAVVSVEEGRAA